METNRLKKAWIWLWYNDITRLSLFLGIPVLFIILKSLFKMDESFDSIFFIGYLSIFIWAIIDNDYSNLRRIGMDEYRRKLK